MVLAQLGQVVGIMSPGSLLVVVIAYLAGQIITAAYILFVDVHEQFPLLGGASRSRISWRWTVGQFTGAFPFGVMNFAEIALIYISFLLFSVFVSHLIPLSQRS